MQGANAYWARKKASLIDTDHPELLRYTLSYGHLEDSKKPSFRRFLLNQSVESNNLIDQFHKAIVQTQWWYTPGAGFQANAFANGPSQSYPSLSMHSLQVLTTDYRLPGFLNSTYASATVYIISNVNVQVLRYINNNSKHYALPITTRIHLECKKRIDNITVGRSTVRLYFSIRGWTIWMGAFFLRDIGIKAENMTRCWLMLVNWLSGHTDAGTYSSTVREG
jgi:hypothetical protein